MELLLIRVLLNMNYHIKKINIEKTIDYKPIYAIYKVLKQIIETLIKFKLII